ncbi:MAG: polysaccharide deacetylase, partial [Rhizobiaceae bacterium]|nr:polysaccharide deacetylase [Rhizobiaceae bacterium]
NAAYVARFGFPFIIAVKGLAKEGILAAFEARIGNDRDTELAAAAREVEKIAAIRIRHIFGDTA